MHMYYCEYGIARSNALVLYMCHQKHISVLYTNEIFKRNIP